MILLSLGGLLACSDDPANNLRGSLTEIFDLAFDATRARLYEPELSIEYLDQTRSGRIAIRVTVDRTEPLAPGRYDLPTRGFVGLADEVGGQLPPLTEGTLDLAQWGDSPETPIVGSFRAIFETPDDQRFVVIGAFDAPLEVVDAAP
ncbi:MAG: hypothetical protein AAF602_30265 [Myxococcota bacterium]